MRILRWISGSYIQWQEYEAIVKTVNQFKFFDKDILDKIFN